ncbi:MAG: PEGA domain-containing protein [Myxococcales bacterium]|nr:PEGA domain-containing protein [Myxococcales bacterium]
MKHWLTSALVIAACATTAFADEAALARERFLAAQALYAAGKYGSALAKFQESNGYRPHPSTRFNIARCQDRLGDLSSAMTSYKEYLRLSPEATDADEVVKAISSLERRLQERGAQHLLVYAEPATASITVDGKDVGASPAMTTLPPGTHTVLVAAPGFETSERSFVLSASRSMELTIALRATPDAPLAANLTPSTSSEVLGEALTPAERRRPLTWVASSTAVVATALGLTFGIMMKNQETSLKTLDPQRTREQADSLATSALTFGTAATASFIAAGVATVTAVLLFFLEEA